MPIPDNAQREATARAAAAAALDAQSYLHRGTPSADASAAQSAVREGTTSTAQAGDIARPNSTTVDPKTGLRKGMGNRQSQTSSLAVGLGQYLNPDSGSPPFP
jgi:hypothetical protein